MANIPLRSPFAIDSRGILTYLERQIILPNISPSYYDIAGIALSLLIFITHPIWLQMLLIALILLTDWLDGATARQHSTCSVEGYMMDVVIDRASEGLIFMAFCKTWLGQAFFILWLLNLALAFYSLRVSKHISLPLRFVFILFLFWTK
jgi:phosphatidylglycerophosphate synthase